jgi:hypothetical protein
MLKNYIKTALRNIRKQKGYSLINIRFVLQLEGHLGCSQRALQKAGNGHGPDTSG